jgi:hypothetical protein
MDVRTPVYASKCYWPGVSEDEVANAARRAGTGCLGTVFFPLDDLVLSFFSAASPGEARRASERAGMPCERVMQAVWLEPQRSKGRHHQ